MSGGYLYWKVGGEFVSTLMSSPSRHKVLSYDKETRVLAVKTPAHTYWAGMLMDRGYAPPQISVLKITKSRGLSWKYDVLISWSCGRSKE